MPVKDDDRGMEMLARSLAELDAGEVTIGMLSNPDEPLIPPPQPAESANSIKLGFNEEPTDLTVGEIAVFHELGRGVPRRSFVADTIDRETTAIENFAADVVDEVMAGRRTGREAYAFLGEFVVDEMKTTIDKQIGFQPLSDARLRQKTNKRGKTANKALIWTGQLINSIRYRVDNRGI